MKLFLAAVAAAILVLPAPSRAAGLSWSDISIQTALAAMDSAPEVPAQLVGHAFPARLGPNITTSSPFYTNFVATTPDFASNLPCFTCVNNGEQDTLGMAIPYNYVPTGSAQTYIVSWTSLNYKGSCKVAVTVAAGKTVVYKFSHTFTGIGDGAYDAFINEGSTSYSGAAQVVAKVTCGKISSPSTAPIIFQ
jgi:hypothetical protein